MSHHYKLCVRPQYVMDFIIRSLWRTCIKHMFTGYHQMQTKKRIRTEQQPIRESLPKLKGLLPSDMDMETKNRIIEKYFDPSIEPNRFKYVSIIKIGGHEPNEVIYALRHAGAFSSHNGRKALPGLISDARNAGMYRGDCTDETLDTLERHAHNVFSLDENETIGCGIVDAADFPVRFNRLLTQQST